MATEVIVETVPLVMDRDGVWRVGGTRVTLDIVVGAFEDGATAEEIAQQYSVLRLADVYAVIGYYLNRQDKVAAYLHGRRERAEEIRKQVEARFNPVGIR
jgi:uncharacterized protein (DUF433 family)